MLKVFINELVNNYQEEPETSEAVVAVATTEPTQSVETLIKEEIKQESLSDEVIKV